MRIDKLTADHKALLPTVREEWLAIGLSTAETDWERAIAGVQKAYGAAGLTPPTIVIRLGSPFAGAVGAAMLAQVRAQVWAQVWDQVRAQVWDQVGDQVSKAGYGSYDAGWLAFYDTFGRVGLDVSRLTGLMEISRSCGWWWPFAGAVILTARPTVLHRDERGRLHCTDGPALAYPDGWAIYASHGVRVPARVIESPESLTAEEITNERNAEVRRVMIERFGQERYICESGAKMVHRDDWGTLWRAELAGDEPLVVVEVVNSTIEQDGTAKRYFLRVHPELRPMHLGANGERRYGAPQKLTAKNAIASTFGLTGDQYNPSIQT